jgi:hypothetical protein
MEPKENDFRSVVFGGFFFVIAFFFI